MKKTLTTIIICLCLLGCKNNSKQEAVTVTKAFYKAYKEENFGIGSNSKKFLSKDLINLIDKSKIKTQKILNSDPPPEDDSEMLQDDIFTGLQFGYYTSFKLGNINLEANKAIVNIHFVSIDDSAGETFQSDDQVVLVNDNGWKIDNVIYGGNNNVLKNTKEVLLEFINYKEE
jgi:hypothetical protein